MPSRNLPSRRNSISCVRFSEELEVLPRDGRSGDTNIGTPPENSSASALPQSRFSSTAGAVADWQFPDTQSATEPAATQSHDTGRNFLNTPVDESRRGSDDTLYEKSDDHDEQDLSRFSLSSYRHPYDIKRPPSAYTGSSTIQDVPPGSNARVFKESDVSTNEYCAGDKEDPEKAVRETCQQLPRRRRGYLTHLIDLYNTYGEPSEEGEQASHRRSAVLQGSRRDSRLVDPLAYDEDQPLEPDDPFVTGIHKQCLEDVEDVEKNVRRSMSYKDRRKEQQRIRIEFNVTSIINRQKFLMKLANALLIFGAPSHRIESQLLSAARILEVDAEFTHMPGLIIASFGDEETKTSQMHFSKCGGRLSLGNLHKLHQIYRSVVHDEISARKATDDIQTLIDSGSVHRTYVRLILAFLIAALICPLAFGGSLVDMWIAGLGSFFLCSIQIGIASRRNIIYANVFEILSVIGISFFARGLSVIRSQVFCYTAISSASVVSILPGYLILTSSLDLASRNILCGSIKMVYALIYTLFLGFGLQFGSDLFLLFDESARHELDTLAARAAAAITVTGTYIADNDAAIPDGLATIGSFTFTPSTPFIRQNISQGCYRPPAFPWYLQSFPWWTQFIIVPIFSILSSVNNEQPTNWDLVVMVVISCISYTANKVADHFIFNRSDVVSAIGAFTVGLLGNVYSRKMGGTAFTTMVTGVLFLVPSGLSEAGGITAQGSATQIGGAMISVTIGITVGLFMSQALVYMFGSRKNAAIFSF
ncbi:hypothetical protein PHLCEN_2v1952 [Hermanssonia centrifuga]|uniref:Threonine/serine exporter-like N-terminal domain-containing protein n=1 Tax=Hermanssonia centrifuga TaxID=98765 RepID=A0A2R6RVJ4_9APHY|nr:hypothetical protein PHLCEN_2v1952 [Hermanssonia centrifuga]